MRRRKGRRMRSLSKAAETASCMKMDIMLVNTGRGVRSTKWQSKFFSYSIIIISFFNHF